MQLFHHAIFKEILEGYNFLPLIAELVYIYNDIYNMNKV